MRDLHPESYGNALGIGMADVTTDRLVRGIDWAPTRVNALSSGMPAKIRVPAHFASDRECLSGWRGRRAVDPAQVTYRVDSQHAGAGTVAVSADRRTALPSDATVEREFAVEWDATGNLRSPFD